MKNAITFILLLLITSTQAQEITVTGTVVDENNIPLPGATVLVKGTTNGTSTDFDGKYSIKAHNGDTLEFSYVGYSSQKIVVNSSNIHVSMQPDNNLEEVVVTAIGVQRKSDQITTASQVVSVEQLRKSINNNAIQALSGKVSGVKINTRQPKKQLSNAKVLRINKESTPTQIILRGNKSISSNQPALIIIDGKVASKEIFQKMNPKNIKGINVLKGASGNALYGNRGANGVIIVSTTKQSNKLKKELDTYIHQQNQSIVNNESYDEIQENDFEATSLNPLSTFSIDVDKAAYSNVRRMINNGQTVPKDAVKIEEFVNYFTYEYPQPKTKHPFSITTDVSTSPWNKTTKLVRIGLQGKTIQQENLPASNLVFLLDVSGSMSSPNKLGLLKQAFKLLINQLREKDKVSIVVYAGAAGLVLEPTSGANKQKIIDALENLEAGGSTAGGQGIELAYKVAVDNFVKGGNNRVILATDGDFNVGASSNKNMQQLIEEKRKTGVFLTCLGFGYGNYKDSKLETLADKGNGNHGYIDTMQEARKMFEKEFGGTMFTIAKDVKIQLEFNPAIVKAYRLIGYENRLLNDEDFVDDTKDAGELGSGHTVTALYEVILQGTSSVYLKNIPDLKYTENTKPKLSDELLTVKFRYKKPDGKKSIEMVEVVENKNVVTNKTDFNFSSAVALFGMKIRESKYTNKATYGDIIALAEKGRGIDKEGYRAEFIRLVKTFK
ncbi:YfbK domain-containing protein [Pseudofulvibacter geojedonensis]|uniref:von Willebrand factor type A domain-containing protein n=1 Tax=Pseudofulvibacter geojedonensis TaxID=1123758 RepID=A0ABW3I3U4_9FLAO